MVNANRKNGYFPGTFFNRTNRILIASDGVYFRIREGEMVGPFATMREAEVGLRSFIRKVENEGAFNPVNNKSRKAFQQN